MPSQARAEETRRRIIDGAIELFAESGYGGASLNQIIRRAHVTPGAFYYHFASKEEVAAAIIDEVAARMADLRAVLLEAPESGLENVIEMTFQLTVLLGQDRSYWVAAYLEHTMARHTQQGIQDFAARIGALLIGVTGAIRASPLRKGVIPEEAARTTVNVIYGCLAMTNVLAGDIVTRLAECWRILLPGLVAPDSLAHFEKALANAVARCPSSNSHE